MSLTLAIVCHRFGNHLVTIIRANDTIQSCTCIILYTKTLVRRRRALRNRDDMNSGLVEHVLVSGHQVAWMEASVINQRTSCRLLLESWHIGAETCSLSRVSYNITSCYYESLFYLWHYCKQDYVYSSAAVLCHLP